MKPKRYRPSMDPAEKNELLRQFYIGSLFPFLDLLDTTLQSQWAGLTSGITYLAQFNDKPSLIETRFEGMKETLIRLGDMFSDDRVIMNLSFDLAFRPQFRHPTGTGGFVHFIYDNGFYNLSDSLTETKITGRIDRPLLLGPCVALLNDIQQHLMYGLAMEYTHNQPTDSTQL